MQARSPPPVRYSLSGYVYVLPLNPSAHYMFILYLTLHGTSVDFPQPSQFCSLYVTFFSPFEEPQFGANHMILPLTLLHVSRVLHTQSRCNTPCNHTFPPLHR